MSRSAIPAEEVAKAVHDALTAQKLKTRYVVGPDVKVASKLVRFLPNRGLDALVRRQFGSD